MGNGCAGVWFPERGSRLEIRVGHERPILIHALVTDTPARWALANPHLTLHIPASSRVTTASGTKRNGMPRRPPLSMRAIMSNIHLLTGVPSFSRWPLQLHFFAKEAHTSWISWISSVEHPNRPGLKVLTDFASASTTEPAAHGIHALPLDYKPMQQYVAKTHNVVSFERQGDCVHCRETLLPNEGLYAMCPNISCEAMGHLTCWSEHALASDGNATGELLPRACKCPSCGGEIQWADMMKELTLRTRDQDAVAKLVKEKKKKKNGEVTEAATAEV